MQFLGIKWQDGCCQIPMDVINKITAKSLSTSKKETQAFLGAVGFWRMHIPNYSLNRYWQHMKGFELLSKWLVLKHSSSWHPDCQCWAGCSKGRSPLHIMQLMLRGVSGLH
ncbi:hypothetical protein QYF61_005844 [Mycteria americana]|uniref:Uncharacterized protein n=1 Tax=Mycteria americana TaxID=33587 RepID=A0AAN7NLK2_MYCAM|nr:hypothetical protein QYF61_005844 [Mycteria americana]